MVDVATVVVRLPVDRAGIVCQMLQEAADSAAQQMQRPMKPCSRAQVNQIGLAAAFTARDIATALLALQNCGGDERKAQEPTNDGR